MKSKAINVRLQRGQLGRRDAISREAGNVGVRQVVDVLAILDGIRQSSVVKSQQHEAINRLEDGVWQLADGINQPTDAVWRPAEVIR